jgi:hypothetical protein
MAVVRYRGLHGSEVRYGLEFDATSATDFERVQDSLVDYMMRRQAELLRQLQNERRRAG